MALQWCDEASSSIAELFSEDKANVDYVLFHLDNPKKSPKMELFSMGKGGRGQVEALLLPESDKVITGAFLASAIDESGSVVSVRRKYIHVVWVGTRVGIMVKGKVNTSLTQPFKDKFPGCATYLQLSDGDVDDLQADVLEKTMLAAGGAHKPTRYSFTNRTLIGSLQLDESSFNDEQRRREEDEKRQAALAEARRKAAEAEARRKAEAERKQAEEDEARRKAEAERRKAEESRMAKLQAEEELRKKREFEEEEARRRKAAEEAAKLKAMTPKAALSDKSLIMLISSMSGNMATSSNQALAKSMLESLDVTPEVIDGAEPANKEMRNNLFSISGLRGKYPQFFLRKPDGEIKFFGDYETLAHYNDTGTLAEQIGGCATPKMATNAPSGQASSVEVTLNGNKLLLLISSMSGDLTVSSNQARVEGILKGLQLPKEELEIMDGCDQSLKDRRNELFGISGIRAKYPQLFLVNMSTGETTFVGNYDDISYLHDTNTLGKAVGLITKTAKPKPTVVSTLNGNKLQLLISSMPGNLEVTSNQTRVQGILTGLHLSKNEVEVLDGCDPAIKDRRNELFGISGIRAKYPQLFLVNSATGETHFVGSYDDISYLHDTNTFSQAVGLVTKPIASVDSAAAPATATTARIGGDQEKHDTKLSSPPPPPELSSPPKARILEPKAVPKEASADPTSTDSPHQKETSTPSTPQPNLEATMEEKDIALSVTQKEETRESPHSASEETAVTEEETNKISTEATEQGKMLSQEINLESPQTAQQGPQTTSLELPVESAANQYSEATIEKMLAPTEEMVPPLTLAPLESPMVRVEAPKTMMEEQEEQSPAPAPVEESRYPDQVTLDSTKLEHGGEQPTSGSLAATPLEQEETVMTVDQDPAVDPTMDSAQIPPPDQSTRIQQNPTERPQKTEVEKEPALEGTVVSTTETSLQTERIPVDAQETVSSEMEGEAAETTTTSTLEPSPQSEMKTSPPKQELTKETASPSETAETPGEPLQDDSSNRPAEKTKSPQSTALQTTESSPRTQSATTTGTEAAAEAQLLPPATTETKESSLTMDSEEQPQPPASSDPPPIEEKFSEPKQGTPPTESGDVAAVAGEADEENTDDARAPIESAASEVTAADLPPLVASESDLSGVKAAEVVSP